MSSTDNTQSPSANDGGFQDIAAFPLSEEQYAEIMRDDMAYSYDDLFADLVYKEDLTAPAVDHNALTYCNQDEG